MVPVGPGERADWAPFGSSSVWLDEGALGVDSRTGRPVLAEDHDESYWREYGYGGTGQVVCLDCFSGLGSDVQSNAPASTRDARSGRATPSPQVYDRRPDTLPPPPVGVPTCHG